MSFKIAKKIRSNHKTVNHFVTCSQNGHKKRIKEKCNLTAYDLRIKHETTRKALTTSAAPRHGCKVRKVEVQPPLTRCINKLKHKDWSM